jgi:acyl-lipid omega-6 desaturase (Delta-12 desaturase)
MVTSDISAADKDMAWQKMVLKYTRPDLKKSIWQICSSLIPYILLWVLMYRSLEWPYWTTILLAIPASGFLIRMFIIFHDCGHGSFFKSKRANDIVGMTMGILSFTPYHRWHNQHRIHHATNGNLDKRGVGDVWTMTVDEYLNASKGKQFFYRIFRNPFILFTFGPLYIFLFQSRFTKKDMTKKEKQNIYFTNIAALATAVLLSLLMGLKAYLLIQLPVLFISHSMGLWLFYIQHQFEDATWERNEDWDYKTAAIKGSSFLKLPVVLQWFTGNIGFHHVHHLSSRIPNYNLPKCHYENDLFKEVKPILLFSTFRALWLHLWDEESLRLISFRKLAAKKLQISAAS